MVVVMVELLCCVYIGSVYCYLVYGVLGVLIVLVVVR